MDLKNIVDQILGGRAPVAPPPWIRHCRPKLKHEAPCPQWWRIETVVMIFLCNIHLVPFWPYSAQYIADKDTPIHVEKEAFYSMILIQACIDICSDNKSYHKS